MGTMRLRNTTFVVSDWRMSGDFRGRQIEQGQHQELGHDLEHLAFGHQPELHHGPVQAQPFRGLQVFGLGNLVFGKKGVLPQQVFKRHGNQILSKCYRTRIPAMEQCFGQSRMPGSDD